MRSFNYKKSFRVINWGYSFDSMLELKYAIFIRNEYEYLHSPVPIYYDPKTKQPTFYIRRSIRRYTPDFLIRHKITGEAFLVEIKPRAFQLNQQLLMRKEVAENYIRLKHYDWSFKVVFSDEINLSASEQADFQECFKLIPKSQKKFWFQKLNDRFDKSRPSLVGRAPSNKIIQFVMFGNKTCSERSPIII